jgi:cell division septal protein FtsQ
MRKYRRDYQLKRLQPTRHILRHQRRRRLKPILSNRFFWLGLLILVFLLSLFYFLFFSEFFQTEKIIVTGEERASKEELRLLVEKKLENKILFFKTKSIFLVNLNETRKEILNNFPQIAEVEISRRLPDAINILVVERLSLAVWCREENCFLLDKEGVIFEETSPETSLPKIIDKQNLTTPALGERIIEKEGLCQIIEIKSKLDDGLKIQIAEVFFIAEERLNLKTSEGWEIYLNPKGDIGWQLTKLRVDLEEEIPPERRKDLEYVELRFGNFAPYKYKD